ncbi:HD domain-containing protein [Falsiroseomonas sp. CW058]|uniref:HD domain-containing protein n=1 Tax=Falsiroseomonas sp. CW058 TaxID=3388664 RepID=UPI003D3177F4
MTRTELEGVLDFLRAAEKLKGTLRTGYGSDGRPESTAEHTWRLSLMAMLLAGPLGADPARLLKICLLHDLAEALTGDLPAPLQTPGHDKEAAERQAMAELTAPLPAALRAELLALWEEYETGSSREGRLARGLDKLETILQHTQGLNAPGLDIGFNLDYGRAATSVDPLLVSLRAMLDAATRRRMAAEAIPAGTA